MKKILIFILIVILVLGGLWYVRQKKTDQGTDTTTSGFKSFFNFGTKKTTPGNEAEEGLSSDFTTPEESPDTTAPENEPGTRTSVFGTTAPFTPGNTPATAGTIAGQQGATTGTIAQGGTATTGTTAGGGTSAGNGSGGTGSGNTGSGPICSSDDLEIDFTPEEIARLQVLERRFYDLAPNLRTDEDVQSEAGNYSSYKTLNNKYTEMIAYCENIVPQLSTTLNKRVATPLYSDSARNQEYFTDGVNPDVAINMSSPGNRPRLIEKLFRLNIW